MAGFQTLIDHLDKPRELRNVVEVRGNHLSDATCLTHISFKSGIECSKFN